MYAQSLLTFVLFHFTTFSKTIQKLINYFRNFDLHLSISMKTFNSKFNIINQMRYWVFGINFLWLFGMQ